MNIVMHLTKGRIQRRNLVHRIYEYYYYDIPHKCALLLNSSTYIYVNILSLKTCRSYDLSYPASSGICQVFRKVRKIKRFYISILAYIKMNVLITSQGFTFKYRTKRILNILRSWQLMIPLRCLSVPFIKLNLIIWCACCCLVFFNFIVFLFLCSCH